MINRKELRIGNYITEVTAFDGFYASVTSIGAEICIYGVGYMALFEKLSPIPLTENWLLDFGFCKTGISRYSLKDYDIYINEENIFFQITTYMDIPPSINLKYVHQLQNLYFALTGEELTLKP